MKSIKTGANCGFTQENPKEDEMNEIKGFFHEYRFLSNFYPAKVQMEGILYPSIEHAYQAAKTLKQDVRQSIRECPDPSKVKRIGSRLELRPDWADIKLDVMTKLVRRKFNIPELRDKLLATGDAYLEETNSWQDVYWGVCKGKGENHLGKILMMVRAEIKESLKEDSHA